MAQEITSNEIDRIVIPQVNWHIELINCVRNAVDSTVIVVDTEAKRELALRTAQRMDKQVTVEVAES